MPRRIKTRKESVHKPMFAGFVWLQFRSQYLLRCCMVSTRSLTGAFASLALSCVLVLSSQLWGAETDRPKGLPNFGRVSDSLFRGAQPTSNGFGALHNMGVSIIVNFRD